MACQQFTKPADHAHGQHQHQRRHQHQHQHPHQQHDHHCFGSHASDKFKGVFKGHRHDHAPPASGANDCHCKASGPKKKKEHQEKWEGGLLPLPADHAHGQHQQKHDQQHDHHCFSSHASDKFKDVFKGHRHDHAPPALGAVHHSANDCHCKASGSKKKEHQEKKEGCLLHKIKEAFSDHSSDSSDSENECHNKKK